MGRVGRTWPKVQVSARLTWTFRAGATAGRTHPVRPRRSLPVAAAGRLVSAVLARRALRAQPPRRLPPAHRALHVRRARHR
ncbi:hypothetical protein ABT121_41095 [Streptomyces sp. NPDC001928]|uniref:hypothetical protein n=1 Tax=Streptomyces sp. NPDC001928 TaxID=3154404 RepID=UPI00331C5E19